MQMLESDRGLRRSFKASPNEGERLRCKKSGVTNGIEAIGDQGNTLWMHNAAPPLNARFAWIA